MEDFMQEIDITVSSVTNRTGKPQDRKTGQSGMPNWTIRFPREQQQLLVVGTTRKH
jgi:hypothetical protein